VTLHDFRLGAPVVGGDFCKIGAVLTAIAHGYFDTPSQEPFGSQALAGKRTHCVCERFVADFERVVKDQEGAIARDEIFHTEETLSLEGSTQKVHSAANVGTNTFTKFDEESTIAGRKNL